MLKNSFNLHPTLQVDILVLHGLCHGLENLEVTEKLLQDSKNTNPQLLSPANILSTHVALSFDPTACNFFIFTFLATSKLHREW